MRLQQSDLVLDSNIQKLNFKYLLPKSSNQSMLFSRFFTIALREKQLEYIDCFSPAMVARHLNSVNVEQDERLSSILVDSLAKLESDFYQTLRPNLVKYKILLDAIVQDHRASGESDVKYGESGINLDEAPDL
jgi:hypothetical protein